MQTLTREQFIRQFPYRLTLSVEVKSLMRKDSIFKGIQVWRTLNLLLIEIDGKYYGH